MDIKISKSLANHLGELTMRAVGVELRDRYGQDHYVVDLRALTQTQIIRFKEALEDESLLKVRGPKVVIRDIENWIKTIKDAGVQTPRTLQHFSGMITEYLNKTEGHRVYKRLDIEGTASVAYYTNKVEYHPPRKERDYYQPASCEVSLAYIEFAGRRNETITFHTEDVQGKTISESLANGGYFAETPALRKAYLAEVNRFAPLIDEIGVQYLAIGTATDGLDGNQASRFSTYSGRQNLLMELEGRASKVVIDVFHETEESRKDIHHSRDNIDRRFWRMKKPKVANMGDEDEEYGTDGIEEDFDAPPEIPIHPFCAIFDLRRHLRMKIHINYLTKYKYDTSLSEQLILPDVTKKLVQTLISQHKVEFKDIVQGKGGGVCVLLAGPPGTGKTLTAEVFAEASERPLYSIQAAQLGIKSSDVEGNLVRFLGRGSRWGAVVLIDEADVYIRERSTDMEHNAICASFLRVLEYQTSVLFMTTNRGELVDDAILSRCIARLDITVPTKEQQGEIWTVMDLVNDLGLTDEEIDIIVDRHPALTGRDIKQLVKLSQLVAENRGEKMGPEIVDFVSQFQPTRER